MKKRLIFGITLILLGLGGAPLSTPGSDQNDYYYEAEPWDDIYHLNGADSAHPDTNSGSYSTSTPDRPHPQQPLPLHKSVKKDPPRRRRLASLWLQIRSFILSIWR